MLGMFLAQGEIATLPSGRGRGRAPYGARGGGPNRTGGGSGPGPGDVIMGCPGKDGGPLEPM